MHRIASPLALFAVIAALLAAGPVAGVLGHVLQGGTSDVLAHLAATVLAESAATTLVLGTLVTVGAMLRGRARRGW